MSQAGGSSSGKPGRQGVCLASGPPASQPASRAINLAPLTPKPACTQQQLIPWQQQACTTASFRTCSITASCACWSSSGMGSTPLAPPPLAEGDSEAPRRAPLARSPLPAPPPLLPVLPAGEVAGRCCLLPPPACCCCCWVGEEPSWALRKAPAESSTDSRSRSSDSQLLPATPSPAAAGGARNCILSSFLCSRGIAME